MALLSPGVEVTVIDESFFAPVVSTSIPYILLATAQDKTNSAGDVAIGTTAENANIVTPVTSRRELVTLFGNPTFVAASTGGVVQAHELNEYGLQVAYSVLGVTNRVYVQRADIDLNQLIGTSVRPTNTPANGTLWLDLDNTDFGLFEWNANDQTFNKITPIVIDDTADESGGVPNADIGTILDYAVVTTVDTNPVYLKDISGAWNLVGSDGAWHESYYTVQGSAAAATLISMSDSIVINSIDIPASSTSLATYVSTDIPGAGIQGVTAALVDGKITFYIDETSASTDNTTDDNKITIAAGTGTLLADLELTAGTFNGLTTQLSKHTSVPTWKSSDTGLSRPTGSVWVKTTTPNLGADWNVSLFDDVLEEWARIDTPLYGSNAEANNALDSTGGGFNIGSGALYVRYDTVEDGTATFSLYERLVSGATNVTGSVIAPTFTPADDFTVQVSEKGSNTLTAPETIAMSGATASTFVQDVINANIDGLTASIAASGAIVLTHSYGGTIVLVEDPTVGSTTTGTPITDAGFTIANTYIEEGNASTIAVPTVDLQLVLSNWVKPTYTASLIQPSVDPADGTQWYFSTVDEVDLMMHDGTTWKGYQNVTNDARNADLSLTDPLGPQVSASEPTLQSDGTALVFGDIWIDTSEINDYPIINRWTNLGSGATGWVTIDNADATTENGILFADARWDTDGTTDTITDDMTSIVDLLTSDWLDLDAPDENLYPRGTILWNTRRSGFNVKQYAVNYFNASAFSGSLPTEVNTWRTVSGLKLDGSPYMGSGAVRNMVVSAMKGGIDSSIDVREERTTINLLTAPFYPELIANLVKVNTDRKDTGFVIGDSPMTLAASSSALANWASNANLAADNGNDGLVSTSEYLGVYYPSGLSNDLEGNAVVMPSSHMSLRTMIKSDNVSYPWIAPAGVRRGKVDNATSIGYVDAATGEFQSIGVGEGLRDVLYTNNVNPISILPGSGITVYGQKTRSGIASSLDRINVARLTANLRYVLGLLSRPFIFEPNDKLTRDEFKNEIEKYLNELVAKRGIYDYLVVCDDSNNTPARIDRNELWADVAIEPVKAAEFIFIPLRLQNTGEI